MQQMWNGVRERGVVILGVNTGERSNPVSAARGFQQKYGLTYPIVVDGDDQIAKRYGVDGFPTNLVIDANGVVRYVGAGYDEEGIQRALSRVLQLTPPTRGASAPVVTVLLGGWKLDCETGRTVSAESTDADLFWELTSKSERRLVPLNGAKVASLGVKSAEEFQKLTAQNLGQLEFSDGNVDGSDSSKKLEPGTVLIVQTRNGRIVKVRIGAGDLSYLAQGENPRSHIVLSIAAAG